jgi:hypothetical protein
MRKLLLASSAVALTIAASTAHAGDCGRPITKDGNVSKVSDALFILQSSVGKNDCTLEDCDVNTDCQVSASDALVSLKASVKGTATHDSCKSECPTTTPCEEAGAPVCNGVCPEGQACVVSEEDGDKRVTICHVPPGNPDNAQTLVVGAPAVPAHLAHGDHLGPCEDGESGGQGNEGSEVDCEKQHGGCAKTGREHLKASAAVPVDTSSCVCQPVVIPSTTTTCPTTTTTLVEPTTTTLPEPTTTLPQPTTTLPVTTTTVVEPTTTLPEPTTTLPQPTTTLPVTTTTVVEPTTTLPEPTTTLPQPTTTLPVTTTTVVEPTTTLPEPTTTLPQPTTTLPVTTTSLLATTTTTLGGGSIEAGQALYDNNCDTCHMAGSHDTTGFAGDLAGKGGNVVNDLGAIDNAMNGITLTNQQVDDLAAFLNSL